MISKCPFVFSLCALLVPSALTVPAVNKLTLCSPQNISSVEKIPLCVCVCARARCAKINK